MIAESVGQLQKMINDLLDLARSDAGKLRIEPSRRRCGRWSSASAGRCDPTSRSRTSDFTVSVEKDLPGRRGRRRPDRPGARQPAHERQQVRTRGRPGDARGDPGRRRGRVRGLGRRARASRRRSSTTSSTASGARESGETQEVGGTGLGLAIAKSLVELHGGAISANSIPGEGATFRFVLPIAKDGRPTRTEPASRTKAGAAGLTRLLVADDSETVLLMLERRLEMEGYDVVTATDGVEALERLREAGSQGARRDPARRDDAEHVGHRGARGAARPGVEDPGR